MAGMSRAGTTFMYHNLQKHPQIFVPVRKELAYFAHHYDKGREWYEGFYDAAGKTQILMDICGIYFTDDNALQRIYEHNPDVKVILCIRNPNEWIFSFYEQYKGNFDVPPFREFLKGCSIIRESKEVYIDFTNEKISKTIQAYKDKFADNLLIYDFKFFADDNLRALKLFEKFLNIPEYFREGNFTNNKINARGRKRNALFERLLQRTWFVEMILTCFPKTIILKLRERWERNSSVNESKPNLEFDDEDHAAVNKMFKKDCAYISELFQESPVVLGTGKPFEY